MAGLRSGALASLVRAVATSLTSLALPLALALVLSRETYNEWALAFAVASVVLYFDLGLPSTIQVLASRAVAGRVPRLGDARAAALAAVAFAGVAVAAALLLAAVFSLDLGRLYPAIPHAHLASLRLCLIVLVVAQGASLITNVASGFFVGVGRNWSMTAVVAPARVVAALACCAVAATTHRLPVIGLAFLIPNLAGALVLAGRIAASTRTGSDRRPREHAREVAAFTAPLLVWGLMMAVVTGLDLLIVGRVDYPALRDYSIGASLSAGVVGISTAALGPLLAHLAGQIERQDFRGTRRDVVRWGAAAGLLAGLGYSASLLLVHLSSRWSGAAPIVALLGLGWTLRMAVTPLSSAVVAAGRARGLTPGAVGEAVANLTLSIVLGVAYGAPGVAAGTAIAAAGACVYQLWAAGHVVTELAPARKRIVIRSFVVPELALLPAAVVATLLPRSERLPLTAGAFGVTAAVAVGLAFALLRGREHTDSSVRGRRRVPDGDTPRH